MHGKPLSFAISLKPIFLLLALALFAASVSAQMKGSDVPGFVGLQAGTQAPPGIYVGDLAYFYNTNTIKLDNGTALPNSPRVSSFIDGIAFAWVTNYKFLGATIGGQLLIPFAQNRLEGDLLGSSATGFGFSDMYLQPIALGWHARRADYVAGYGIYFPTGSFTPGASDNKGLGIYTNELSFGSTYYLNDHKSWNVSALAAYAFASKKRGIDETPGQIMTIQGGLGHTIMKKTTFPIPTIMNVGLIGYTQFKTTNDSGSALPPIFLGVKDRVFALGPEFNILWPKQRMQLTARYFAEFEARDRTQGQGFVISFTYIAKSLARMPEPPPPSSTPPPPPHQ
jgi:hypothetical protein